jgi:hypothetical protein
MYVTQTFLGLTAEGAKRYIYFLSEGYKDEKQARLYENVSKRVAGFGLSTGRDTAVVMPHAGFQEATLGEVRDGSQEMQKFYQEHIYGETPGLLVTRLPVSDPNAHEGALYFSLANTRGDAFFETTLVVQSINKASREGSFWTWLETANKFFKLEPNFFGVGFNGNKAIEKLIERRQR